jgi:hypothetical protein
LRARLARKVAVSLNNNISAFGYSFLIAGCFAWISALGHSAGVIGILTADDGAVLAFPVFEPVMLTVFRDLRSIDAERNRFLTGLRRVISVPGGMGGTMLCTHYLTSAGARPVGGLVVIGNLFLILVG